MRPDILIVDDDPGTIRLLGQIVAPEGSVRFATNGADALRLARARPPDLLLLDAELPDVSGFDVCTELKFEPAFADIPVVFVSSHRDESFEIAGFRVGASDFIAKPINPKLVLERVRAQLRVKRMSDQLRSLASTDALTGIANRRRLDEVLDREWKRARRSRSPLALALIDVDHFKAYNDHHGHAGGDACLRAIASVLTRACLRPADLVARHGGEEFAVLLPETPLMGAEHVARRILAGMESLALPHPNSLTAAHVTVSMGLASYVSSDTGSTDENTSRPGASQDDPSRLYEYADLALYAAKRAGRARAHVILVPAVGVNALESVPLASVVTRQ